MSKVKFPRVRRKRAKGTDYYYWAGSKPWVRLPDPITKPDDFMRKLTHLERVAAANSEKSKQGTFGGLVAAYRKTTKFQKLSANTHVQYERYLKRLLARYHAATLAEITPEDIQIHVLDPNDTTPGAANAMLSIMRVLYTFAQKRNRGLENWTAGLEPFEREEDNERQPWPEELLQEALASDDELFRRAVTLALYTGQRPGDVCAMTWGKVKGDEIEVRQQKTGEHLTITMHDELRTMLATVERSDRHIFILSNRRGDRLTAGTFLTWCQDFTRARGFQGTAHGLRKNATNALFEAECTTAQVAAITGHRSLQMLEHYGKRRDRRAIGRVAIAKWGTKTKREREN